MNLVYKPMNFDMPLESKQINQITIEDARLYERMVTSIYWQIRQRLLKEPLNEYIIDIDLCEIH